MCNANKTCTWHLYVLFQHVTGMWPGCVPDFSHNFLVLFSAFYIAFTCSKNKLARLQNKHV